MTDAARAELAARYQLVTPFSGAVVLETQAQYDEHGLTPADGDATPQDPERARAVVEPAAGSHRRRRADEEEAGDGSIPKELDHCDEIPGNLENCPHGAARRRSRRHGSCRGVPV